MGFPSFERISEYPSRAIRTKFFLFFLFFQNFSIFLSFFFKKKKKKNKKVIWITFGLGLGLFFYLLFPLTDPSLYQSVFWN